MQAKTRLSLSTHPGGERLLRSPWLLVLLGCWLLGLGVSGAFAQSATEPTDPAETAMMDTSQTEQGTTETPSAVGAWEGEIKVPGQGLKIRIELEAADAGGLVGTIDIPAQAVRDLALTDVAQEGDTVRFALGGVPGNPTFEGQLDGSTLAGTYRQGGAKLGFELERTTVEEAPPARPQTPSAPFPYRREEVSVTHTAANGDEVTLAGTLTLPDGDGPFVAVALASGSGPQDRDSTVFEHKPFWVLADHLTRAGIAVLRYDDRGTGDSTGDFGAATTADFSDDAVAAVTYLGERPEIDAEKVGIIGLSEGGIVGPVAAAQSDRVGFVVMLAGPTVPGAELLPTQSEAIALANGADAFSAGAQAQILRKTLEVIVASDEVEEARRQLLERGRKQILASRGEDATVTDDEAEAMEQQIDGLLQPWMVHFLKFDPATALAKVRVPVLALNGELDTQVLAEQNLGRLREIFAESGPEDATIEALEGLNHLFQPAETGSPAEYYTIETTLAPELLERVTEWILQRFAV